MSIRRTALEALMDITDNGAYANLRLKAALEGLEERDAKWLTAAVYETLDHLLYIDYIIAAFAKGKIKPQIRGILRLGVCQALYMNVPDSAACNESVKLAKEIGKGALGGYINGVMRNICRSKDALPELPADPVKRLSIKFSYPEYLVKDYLSAYGEEFTEKLLSHKEAKGMTVRAQHPYTSDELCIELDKRGLAYKRGDIANDAFKLEKGLNVTAEPLFNEGKITVQSESAMLVCKALEPKAGMRILDACSAPGGKSAYIYSLTKGECQLCSWELHEHRAELIKNTFARLGVKADVQVKNATVDYQEFHDAFDAVLIDAPCSGLGVPGKPDARYAKNDAIIDEISDIQGRILDACAKYVKSGGTLVYATCTISKRENEAQINAFLNRHSEFEAADISELLPENMKSRVEGGCMLQLFPHLDGTEGFFLAKMKRR